MQRINKWKKILFWPVLILSILFVVLIALSNLDVLNAGEKKGPAKAGKEETKQADTPLKKSSEVKTKPHEAMFYEKISRNRVVCNLCPWECMVKPGRRGRCRVRENQGGKLIALTYSKPCSLNLDPIEKKPFYHFMPGEDALSLATAGCNLRCKFCQNWSISQAKPEELDSLYIPPANMVRLAKRSKAKAIAYTYSEPIVYYEYMLDIARLAKKEGIKNVVISGGFINPEPLKLLCKHVDAIKIDLKAFSEKYYKEVVGGKLGPVLDTLKTINEEGVHLEIVYLVVPTMNDDPDEIRKMSKWIVKNLGRDIPLHYSRFHPQYKMKEYPPTPLSTIEKLRKISIKQGIKYVYAGNVAPSHEGGSTYCPKCGKKILDRYGYELKGNNIKKGKCKFCDEKIYGVW